MAARRLPRIMRTLLVETAAGTYWSCRIDPEHPEWIDWDHVQRAAIDEAFEDDDEFGLGGADHVSPEGLVWSTV